MSLTEEQKAVARKVAMGMDDEVGLSQRTTEWWPVRFAERFLAAQPTSDYMAERDALAQAIARMATKLGIINGDMPLTGPQLVMLCDDAASFDQPASEQKPVGRGWLNPSTGKLVCAAPDGPVHLYAGPISSDFKASTEEEGDAFAHGYFAGLECQSDYKAQPNCSVCDGKGVITDTENCEWPCYQCKQTQTVASSENYTPFYDVEEEARSLCDELLTCGMDRCTLQRALSKAYAAGKGGA